MNIPIKVIAIPTRVAELVRQTRKAPGYGHPAHIEVASGYGPCRHCLKTFVQGAEERVLFTYDPFHGIEEVPLPGPIFIQAQACERYPEDGGYPEALRQYASVLSAYGAGLKLLTEVRVHDGGQPAAIQEFFRRPEVHYIHVRDKSAGCFDFRVQRAAGHLPGPASASVR